MGSSRRGALGSGSGPQGAGGRPHVRRLADHFLPGTFEAVVRRCPGPQDRCRSVGWRGTVMRWPHQLEEMTEALTRLGRARLRGPMLLRSGPAAISGAAASRRSRAGREVTGHVERNRERGPAQRPVRRVRRRVARTSLLGHLASARARRAGAAGRRARTRRARCGTAYCRPGSRARRPLVGLDNRRDSSDARDCSARTASRSARTRDPSARRCGRPLDVALSEYVGAICASPRWIPRPRAASRGELVFLNRHRFDLCGPRRRRGRRAAGATISGCTARMSDDARSSSPCRW